MRAVLQSDWRGRNDQNIQSNLHRLERQTKDSLHLCEQPRRSEEVSEDYTRVGEVRGSGRGMINMKVLDYRIVSDTNQVTVSKVRRDDKNEISMTIDKDGIEREATAGVGFYPNLDRALRGIQKHYTLSEGTEIQTIKDYRKALEEVQEAFRIELGVNGNENN